MLIGGIVLGLVLGLLLGGRLENLAAVRLRHLNLLFLAVIIRFGTELGLQLLAPIEAAAPLVLPRLLLFGLAYGLLLFVLWKNRTYPGMALAFVGIAMNALVIMVNAGRMPVWQAAFDASGLTGEISTVLHKPLESANAIEFLLTLGPLGDIIPIPIWPVQNVASLGDVFLTAGLAFFLFATLIRRPEAASWGQADTDLTTVRAEGAIKGAVALPRPDALDIGQPGIAVRPGTGLTAAFDETVALDRPLMMGAGAVTLTAPGAGAMPAGGAEPASAPSGLAAGATTAIRRRRRSLLLGAREHPYIRLATNGSFSALWIGQVISLFGDRINQVALAAFVYEVTDSPLHVALTFLVGTIPNLFFSPIAGTFVDRWDQKQVLVVSDILRAALVLLLPVAILTNVWLAYPLVFLITTVSIFFRPARVAVLPRIVREDDLLAANSATWVAETLADIVLYPLAGLFVVFLAQSLALAFWFDAATYLASAILLSAVVVPPIARRARGGQAATAGATAGAGSGAGAGAGAGAAAGAGAGAAVGDELDDEAERHASVLEDLRAGWAFLRNEATLLANTIQGTAGQVSLGVLTVASLILAKEITEAPGEAYRGTYAFMETAIGVGALVGGFTLGLVAGRARKGRLIIAAYTAFGVCAMLLGLVSSVPLVLIVMFAGGIANMAFVIPSQTLFQERTPPELMGRVVSFRFALVFGGMSVAMGVGGVLVSLVGPQPVIFAAGVLSVAAGLGGLLVPAVRDA
jgi:MFS family permease